MSGKRELKVLVKSAEGLAYALRDTLDVIADHEARIKRIEQEFGILADLELFVLLRGRMHGVVTNETSAFSQKQGCSATA